MDTIIIDPGHGGSAPAGSSTPFGVRGPGGVAEKDVTLELGRLVAARLGAEARLTRDTDVNLPLAERAAIARAAGARAFVSLHANGNGGGARGVEAWVHANAQPASLALADRLRAAVAGAGVPDRGTFRGELAVLQPAGLPAETAACLLEVDYLDHPDGELGLSDPLQLDALADAIAQALAAFGTAPVASGARYGRGAARFGSGTTLDLTDFSSNAMVIVPEDKVDRVPADITQAELDELERAWDCMMRGTGINVDGSADDRRAFRNLLLGGLVYSPFIRRLFVEAACDDAHPITFHVGRSQPGIFVDAFQWPGVGEHTFDLDDFEQLPQVSGDPRNFMQLRTQILVHALREARQGALGNTYLPSHRRAIDDENVYRQEQGQIGNKDYAQPYLDAGSFRFDLTHNGAVAFWEKWNPSGAGNDIATITYSP